MGQIFNMFTTVARRNAGAKAPDVMVVRPHKFIMGKGLQYWANHGKHIKAELIPNPVAIMSGVQLLPLTPSRSSPAVSSRCLSESSSSPEQSPLKSSFGSPSEKSSERGRSSVTIPETSANKWAPHSSSESHSQNPSPSQTSCAN